MLLNQDTATASGGGAAMPAATACCNCGGDERSLLHNFRHRGIFRRLCTSCVLRLHPESFCPTCFSVYYTSPPPSSSNGGAVTCFKCYSASHPHCVGPNSPSPYICPLCVDPNALVSVPKRAKYLNLSDGADGRGVNYGNSRVIDKKAARALLAAARISAASMSKAALAARAEAERRAKEAALARKRAREALEHATILMAREKLKKNEPVEISRSGGNLGGMVRDKRAIVNNNNNNNCNSRVGNAGSGKAVVGAVEWKNRVNIVDRRDSSNEVLAALNAVELREKKSRVVKPHGLIPGPSLNDGVAMEVEENRGMPSYPSLNDSSSGAPRNHGGGKTNERYGDSATNQNDLGEKVNNGEVQAPSKQGQMQGVENGHAGEPDNTRSWQ